MNILKDEIMWDGKKIIYIDMDHTLCDYHAGFIRHQKLHPQLAFPQSQPGLYFGLEPLPGALDTYQWLGQQAEFAVFILTAPSIKNPHSYSEKRLWVEKHLGMAAVKQLIISPHKGLNRGNFLIDDKASGNGQEYFEGRLIQFGSDEFPDWLHVRRFFETVLGR